MIQGIQHAGIVHIKTFDIDSLSFHSFYQRMQELSRVFKDRPKTPQETVVYWTEYVIRHNGAPHLQALGADMPLYRYLMLDIIALAFVILYALFYLFLGSVRKVRSVINGKSKRE